VAKIAAPVATVSVKKPEIIQLQEPISLTTDLTQTGPGAPLIVKEKLPPVIVVPETAPALAAATPTPTAAPAPPVACVDDAAFVGDLTVPENSAINPGVAFDKAWRIRNTGTCAWAGRYQLVFVSGDILGRRTASAWC